MPKMMIKTLALKSMQHLPKTAQLYFLTGMPGAGKTHWGNLLAKQYQWPFFDLDRFIEENEKETIAGLFNKYGETGFRQMESDYLKKAIGNLSAPAIIACGGGTPCFFNNTELMKNSGSVIYLEATVDFLLGNINRNPGLRPLLTGKEDPLAFLEMLLAQRKPFYEQADYILQANTLSLPIFAQIFPDV
jgi:shikimate kinase